MINKNTQSIIIVRREGAEPLASVEPQPIAEEAEREVSSVARMFAVVLLAAVVAAGAGVLGLIAYLSQ